MLVETFRKKESKKTPLSCAPRRVFRALSSRFILLARLNLLSRTNFTAAMLIAGLVVQVIAQPASSKNIRALVRSQISEAVLAKLKLPPKDVLIEFPDLDKLADNHNVVFEEVRFLPSRHPIRVGVQMVRCGLFKQSHLIETINVKIKVRTFAAVVVSAADISRHEILQPEYLSMSRLETTSFKRGIFTQKTDVTGLRTKRVIRTGEIVTANMVEVLPLIGRGSEVEIKFARGSLEIVLPGVAREDGLRGEEIRVQCLENRKSYDAKIIDSNTVIVNLL